MRKNCSNCHEYGAQLIISWPVGYAAKRVRRTWLFLERDDSLLIVHERLAAGDQSEPAVISHVRDFQRRIFPICSVCLYVAPCIYVHL